MSFLLNRLSKTKSEDAMHSSVYGTAQNEGAFGTTSVTSFEDRMRIDQNRQTVRKYSDSQVVSEAGRKEKINSMREKGADDRAGFVDSATSGSRADVGSSARNTSAGVRGFTSDIRGDFGRGVRSVPGRMSGASGGTRGVSGGSLGASSRPAPSRPPARRNPGIFR